MLFPALCSQKCFFHMLCFSSATLPCTVLADACPVAAHRTSVFLVFSLSSVVNADLKASAPDEKSSLSFLPCREPSLHLQQSQFDHPVASPCAQTCVCPTSAQCKGQHWFLDSMFQMLIKPTHPVQGRYCWFQSASTHVGLWCSV